jgi:hypothetical protein
MKKDGWNLVFLSGSDTRSELANPEGDTAVESHLSESAKGGAPGLKIRAGVGARDPVN